MFDPKPTQSSILSRFRRTLAALAIGLLAATMGMSHAAAAPPTGPDGPGPNPLPEVVLDVDVSGSIDLDGCQTSADNVKVSFHGSVAGGSFNRTANTQVAPGGKLVFSTENLPHVRITVKPKLLNGACPGSIWTKRFIKVKPPTDPDPRFAGIDFVLRTPDDTIEIPGNLVATLAQAELGDLAITLDNFGKRHGTSRHEARASSIRLFGQTSTFTIPEVVFDLDCGVVCPDLGDAKFYVKNLNSDTVSFTWEDGSLVLDISFESRGREVKGYYKAGRRLSDNLMPDAQIDEAHLIVRFTPVADGNGSITLRLSEAPTFDADIAATGPCRVFGYDICDPILSYKATIADSFSDAATAQFGSAETRDQIADVLRAQLDVLDIGEVISVEIVGDIIVINTKSPDTPRGPALPPVVVAPAAPVVGG